MFLLFAVFGKWNYKGSHATVNCQWHPRTRFMLAQFVMGKADVTLTRARA